MKVLSEKFGAAARQFIRDEDGAITLDWVILTAGIVVMAIGVMTLFDLKTPEELHASTPNGVDPRGGASFLSVLMLDINDAVYKFRNTIMP